MEPHPTHKQHAEPRHFVARAFATSHRVYLGGVSRGEFVAIEKNDVRMLQDRISRVCCNDFGIDFVGKRAKKGTDVVAAARYSPPKRRPKQFNASLQQDEAGD